MNILRFCGQIYDVIKDYERRADYDATAYLLEQLNVLRKDISELRLSSADKVPKTPT